MSDEGRIVEKIENYVDKMTFVSIRHPPFLSLSFLELRFPAFFSRFSLKFVKIYQRPC